MKAEFISREDNTINMTMEITAEEFDAAINDVYKTHRHRFTVPGFRKGKAPRRMVENFYGKEIFQEEALTNVFNENYPTALEEIGDYEPVDNPDVDLGDQDLSSGNNIVFNIKFLTEPEITVEDYRGIEVSVPSAEVTEDDVNDRLHSYAVRNARLVTVDREARVNDTVTLDYKGFTKDGEQFEGGTAENAHLKLGSNQFIPEFEDQLIGCVADEERKLEVRFPENYHEPSLAGQVVDFECKIHEVKEEELPEIDDDFATECSEYDTLEEWKEKIREELTDSKASMRRDQIKNEITNVLLDREIVDIPEVMIEHEIDDLLRNFDQQLSYSGMNLQQYIEETQTDMEEFREQIRMDAERKVKARLLIEAIAKQEGIEVTEDDLTEELRSMGVQYGVDAEQMREMVGGDIKYIRRTVASRKAMDILADAAEVTDLTFGDDEDAEPEFDAGDVPDLSKVFEGDAPEETQESEE